MTLFRPPAPVLSFAITVGLFSLVCGPGPVAINVRAQESDLDAFRQLHSQLRERMEEDLQDAVTFLESSISKHPDSEDHNVLRHSLASRFMEQREFAKANGQFRHLLDFYLRRSDQSSSLYGAVMTIASLEEIADISGDNAVLGQAVEDALQAFKEMPSGSDTSLRIPFSKLRVLQAQLMVEDGEIDAASDRIDALLRESRELIEPETEDEALMSAYIDILVRLTRDQEGNDPWREDCIDELDRAVDVAIEAHPNSRALQNYFADTQLMMMTKWRQDDPDATKKRMEDVSPVLNRIAMKNRSVRATLRRIELHRKRISNAKPVASLVGQPAPEWDVDGWVNVIEMDREDLNGKVVLLDFWAMWCGPCIATFPHLRDWREEFGDQGFEIVGVTQYYGFQWDDDAKRASPAKGDVSSEDERQTLASFLDHHDLQHPVVVTPEGSGMQAQYGVRGIPHAVLIDREGIVRLVKTGAGKSTAEEIRAKIKELLHDGED